MTLLLLKHLALNTERKLVDILNASVKVASKLYSNSKITADAYDNFLNQVDDLCDYCPHEWDDLPRILEGNYREYYTE